MSQNNQIINYLKGFSDAMFPVTKQRERLAFQRNVETAFGGTGSLMDMGEATSSPPLGSLVFWEDANGTAHCGIAVAKNGFKVYSITQQKGLREMPQGVRAMEARALLEKSVFEWEGEGVHPTDKGKQIKANGSYDAKTGIYTVAEGDTIEGVSARFGIKTKYLPNYPILEGEKYELFTNQNMLIKRTFEECLQIVVTTIQTIGFGTFSGANSGTQDSSDRYDEMYWEEMGESDMNGAYEVVLRLKKNTSPALAIGKILTNQSAWSIDCSLFVQVSFLLAMKSHLGDKEFDEEINAIVTANQSRFRLRHHHSFGVVQTMAIFRKLVFNKTLKDYDMPTTTEYFSLVNGVETPLNTITTTIQLLLTSAPIGSRVAIMCLNVSKDDPYRIENTIKVGDGLYAGHPLSVTNDGKTTNILTLANIFQQIATQIVARDPTQNATTIIANLFVSEIEHYDMSWEKK